jgi:hypothetical protein
MTVTIILQPPAGPRIATAAPADDLLTVRAFHNTAYDQGGLSMLLRGLLGYQAGDPLNQVASSRCRADADPGTVCEAVFKLLNDMPYVPHRGHRRPEGFPRAGAIRRSFSVGDVVSIADTYYYTCTDFGFLPIARPRNITVVEQLPDLV